MLKEVLRLGRLKLNIRISLSQDAGYQYKAQWLQRIRFYSSGTSQASSFYLEDIDSEKIESSLLIGLYNKFSRKANRCTYFKPIASTENGSPDKQLQLMKEIFNLPQQLSALVGIDAKEAQQLLSQGRQDVLLEKVYGAYYQLQKDNDFIFIEGVPHFSQIISAQIASSLQAPVIFYKNFLLGDNNTQQNPEEIYNQVRTSQEIYHEQRADSLGFVINQLPKDLVEEYNQQFKQLISKDNKIQFLGGIPKDDLLTSVRQSDVVSQLGADTLTKNQKLVAEVPISDIVVACSGIEYLLPQLKEQRTQYPPLILTSSDRMDVVFGLLLTDQSGYVSASGVILCGPPPTYIKQVLEEAHELRQQKRVLQHQMPIYYVDKDVYEVSKLLSQTVPEISQKSFSKIEQSKAIVQSHINLDAIMTQVDTQDSFINPRQFQHILKENCKNNPQHVVLPEGNDVRVLQAAHIASQQGLAKLSVIGNEKQIQQDANKLGLDFSNINIVDHMNSSEFDKYVDLLVEARKSKNLSKHDAADQMSDVAMYGTMMVTCGDADGMVSGACHTTANTIRPGLQVLKNRQRPTVSSVFFMLLPDKVYVYGDCAVIVDPSPDELAQIAVTSAETAAAFGIEPRVAMLSFSTMGSGSGPQVDKVIKAVGIAQKLAPHFKIEGPLQYDAAVDPTIAAKKVKESKVAGKANVLIFPDLNTGNNTYKAVQQSTGAIAMGPIMQGLTKPVNDLSRGCTVNDIVNTICATSAQAQYIKSKQS